ARLGPGDGRLRPGTRTGAAVADGGRHAGRRRGADGGPARRPVPRGPAPAGPCRRDAGRGAGHRGLLPLPARPPRRPARRAAAAVARIAVVLPLLGDWPAAVAAVAVGATVLIPLSLVAGGIPRLAPHGGRLLVHVLWVAGFSLVVAAVYVVIVLGLGKGPADA